MLQLRPITGVVAVSCCGWNAGGRTYDRSQNLVEWVNGQGSLTIWRAPLQSGPVVLPANAYPVTVAGVAVAEALFRDGAAWAKVTFDSSALPDGWVSVECQNLLPGEWAPMERAYNRLSDRAPGPMPVYEDSHKRPENPTHNEQAMCWAPPTYTPRAVPLPLREFSAVTAATQVRAQMLTRNEASVNLFIPNISRHGTVNSFTTQAYSWFDMYAKWPMVPLLDGPRGVGTLPLVAHIEVGMAAPDGVPRRTWYAATPWAVSRGRPDGSTTTLVGWRHAGMASHWTDGAAQKTLELVGDWSAVPADRRGLWALRSFCWDAASLAVDEALPRIPGEAGAPHVTGPVMYIAEQRESANADTATGRVLRVEFSARAHDIPPLVTEFITGLHGPWGVVDWGDWLIVSERNANRIWAHQKTGTLPARVLLQADPSLPGTAVVQQSSIPKVTGSLDERRAQPCLAPEDLKLLDGMLYFGSHASACIKRYDLGALQPDPGYMLPVEMDRQSWAVKFAISDGTFSPRGTVFYNTWGQVKHAAAFGTQPDGARFTAHGKAAPWASFGYPFAIAVGDNRMYFAGSNIGITRFSSALAGEAPISAEKYRAGNREWDAQHGDLSWGPCGFGDHGVALPWGTNPAIDYYLAAHDLPPPTVVGLANGGAE